jgi:Ca-activated chloride channel homolog
MVRPGDFCAFFRRDKRRTGTGAMLALGLLLVATGPGEAQAGVKLTRGQLQAALDSVPEKKPGKTLSPYFFVFGEDPGTDRMPLKSTRADVIITGVIAHVTVTQVYKNEGNHTLEAVYLFPASTRAAVHAMRMTIGDRATEARIRERAKAKEEYDKALEEGKTASLLEQKRPNVFQMSVGNILPGDEIRVELEYTELMVPEKGTYQFVYPTVVGPRYSNRGSDDASEEEKWVENPYLHEGEDPVHTFGLDLSIQSGIPIAKVSSPSHDVSVEFTGKKRAHITQEENRKAGNRDFVVRYSLAGDAIEHGLLLYPGKKENYFLLMMEPPARTEPDEIVPREYIFIMDVSGSMGGFPLDVSKQLMRELLGGLGTGDSFNLLLFAGGNAVLSRKSLPATAGNIQKAVDLIDAQQGGGGTELLPALERALALPRQVGVSRTVVVATDGYVDVEKETFSLIRRKLGEANLFAFGIGSSVNRHIIEGMARAGMGEPFVVLDETEAGRKAKRFREYVSAPLMQGIEVAFEGMDAYDVEPKRLPDLFAERPLVLAGKYRGKAEGAIVIRGHGPDEPLEGRIVLEDAVTGEQNAAIETLWARQRVSRLADLVALEEDDAQVQELTRLGIEHHILTAYTSFVAVDTEVRAGGEKVEKIRQPLPLPLGVRDSAVGFGGLAMKGRGVGAGGVAHRMPMARSAVMGSLSRGSVQSGIQKHLRSIQACYEKALKSDPTLSGKVVVKFVIGPKGTVTSAQIVSSTVKNYTFQSDLLDVIRRMTFPTPAGGGSIVVSYPFIFHSVGGK